MNLVKLFETQAELDHKIEDNKQLQGVDLFKNKVQALLCEIQECANEQRTWKFWSEDQEPRTLKYEKPKGNEYDVVYCRTCGDYMGVDHESSDCFKAFMIPFVKTNPLLEETADCLHFILSLGNDLKVDIEEAKRQSVIVHQDIISQFISLSYVVSCIALHNAKERYYLQTVGLFKGLVHLLGFTDEQLEQAYYDKNKINHERQNTGY